MDYNIKFIYKDGKDICVNVEDKALERFFERLSQSKIFWSDKAQENGFWLDLNQIRYVQFFGQGSICDGEAENRDS